MQKSSFTLNDSLANLTWYWTIVDHTKSYHDIYIKLHFPLFLFQFSVSKIKMCTTSQTLYNSRHTARYHIINMINQHYRSIKTRNGHLVTIGSNHKADSEVCNDEIEQRERRNIRRIWIRKNTMHSENIFLSVEVGGFFSFAFLR